MIPISHSILRLIYGALKLTNSTHQFKLYNIIIPTQIQFVNFAKRTNYRIPQQHISIDHQMKFGDSVLTVEYNLYIPTFGITAVLQQQYRCGIYVQITKLCFGYFLYQITEWTFCIGSHHIYIYSIFVHAYICIYHSQGLHVRNVFCMQNV